jgi:hypothetical protein
LTAFAEVETGEVFRVQNPRLLKVELSETGVLAKNDAMVALSGGRALRAPRGWALTVHQKPATGESLRLMQAAGNGELFLAYQAMLVHVLRGGGEPGPKSHPRRAPHPQPQDVRPVRVVRLSRRVIEVAV